MGQGGPREGNGGNIFSHGGRKRETQLQRWKQTCSAYNHEGKSGQKEKHILRWIGRPSKEGGGEIKTQA